MQTSNFSRICSQQDGFGSSSVSIALLAPRREMLKMDEATYREKYQTILDNLDPWKVYEDLGENSILICWEAPGKFCHRRLVAEWLEADRALCPIPELHRGWWKRVAFLMAR